MQSGDTLVSIVRLLWALTTSCAENKELFVDSNGIEMTVEVMKAHPDNAELLSSCYTMLWVVMAKSETSVTEKARFRAAGGVETLIASMHHHAKEMVRMHLHQTTECLAAPCQLCI